MDAKTRTRLFTGYKRHVVTLVDADVIVGAIVRPANEPEHQALALLTPDLAPHGPLAELLIDRGYFGSPDMAPCTRAALRFAPKREQYQSGPVSEGRVCDPPRRGARHVSCAADRADYPRRRGGALRRCPARPARSARRAQPPAAAAPSQFARRKHCCRSLRAHQRQPEGRGPAPAADGLRTRAGARRSTPGPKAALQGIGKGTFDVRARRRHRQSPADRSTPEGRVNLRALRSLIPNP